MNTYITYTVILLFGFLLGMGYNKMAFDQCKATIERVTTILEKDKKQNEETTARLRGELKELRDK